MSRPPVSNEARFWKRVNKDGLIQPHMATRCWVWTGYFGFCVRLGVKNHEGMGPHRYSYLLHTGVHPDELYVCHHCDNPRCVNPEHLFLGTALDNNHDCIAKDRNAKGNTHGRSKLTEELVRKIRKRHRFNDPKNGAENIARELGMNGEVVRRAIRGQTWKHVV